MNGMMMSWISMSVRDINEPLRDAAVSQTSTYWGARGMGGDHEQLKLVQFAFHLRQTIYITMLRESMHITYSCISHLLSGLRSTIYITSCEYPA